MERLSLPGERIRPGRLNSNELDECASMMAGSEPWVTLGRTVEQTRAALTDPGRDVFAVRDESGVSAFVVIDMRGTFAGYIATICVRADQRGHGLGGGLLEWAEQRIFKERPNVFLCVSSFNDGARRLYERSGYDTVGALRGFLVPEHDEILMRKSLGAWSGFVRATPDEDESSP